MRTLRVRNMKQLSLPCGRRGVMMVQTQGYLSQCCVASLPALPQSVCSPLLPCKGQSAGERLDVTQVRTAGTFRTWMNPELCKSMVVHLFYTPAPKVLAEKNVKFALKIWRNHLEK